MNFSNCMSCNNPATHYIIVYKVIIADKSVKKRRIKDKENSNKTIERMTTAFTFNDRAEEITLHLCDNCKKERMIIKKRNARIIMYISAVLFTLTAIIPIILRLFYGYTFHGIMKFFYLTLFYGSIFSFIAGGFKYILADDTEEELASSVLYEALVENILKLHDGIEFIEEASLIPYDDLFLEREKGQFIYMTSYDWQKLEAADYKLKIITDDGNISRIIPSSLDCE